MKRTPEPEYRDDYVRLLTDAAASGALHAVRLNVNADGSRTDLNLLAVVGGGILDVTLWAAHALREPVYRTGVRPWALRESSGGTNPVTGLQERLARVLGVNVKVHES